MRTAVKLHLPEDLDTASILALLQEEEMESQPYPEKHYKAPHRQDRFHKEKTDSKLEDKKKQDTGRWEDKLNSLKAYRRANNLCFTSGEKYSHTHKCPDQIPLHIIEKLMEVLPSSKTFDQTNSDIESEGSDICMIAAVA